MLLVVGLGNPGSEYADHRHNIGFMTVDHLARQADCTPFRKKFSGVFTRAVLGRADAMLFKPMTYMNLSGSSVQPCAAFFKVEPSAIIVVHDELDLPFGSVRLKKGGGHAGHNGLRSILGRLGTPEFCRVRMGIGRPPASFRGEVADYVLSRFSAEEQDQLPQFLKNGAKSVLDIAARGFDAAIKRTNTRPKKKKAPKPEAPPTEADPEAGEQ